MRKALIRDGVVVNAVVVDAANVLEWLAVVARDYDHIVEAPDWVSTGCRYINNEFVAAPPAPQPCWVLDTRAFRFRFTMAEDAGIVAAARTDPEIEALLARLAAMPVIDLRDDPRVRIGLDLLVAKNLLTPARRQEIMECPASAKEAWAG